MERLTEYLGGIPHIKRTINGINSKANYLRDFDIEAVKKLAAYEDTGLEPEQCAKYAQVADVSKMICDLIAYAQKNADESREAEQRHYGSDSTVNVYTWMHNVKRVHERYVAMLADIAAKLPEPPKEVE